MRGTNVDGVFGLHTTASDLDGCRSTGQPANRGAACDWLSDFEDARIPGAVALFGVLVTVACLGLLPSTWRWLSLVVNVLAGWLLFLVASGTLPSLNAWTFPLTSLAGGAAVVTSLGRRIVQNRK
jgi:hypothetical protein